MLESPGRDLGERRRRQVRPSAVGHVLFRATVADRRNSIAIGVSYATRFKTRPGGSPQATAVFALYQLPLLG